MKYGRTRTSATVSKRTMLVSGALSAALLFGGATFVAHEATADQGKSAVQNFSENVKKVQEYEVKTLSPNASLGDLTKKYGEERARELYRTAVDHSAHDAEFSATFKKDAKTVLENDMKILHPNASKTELQKVYGDTFLTPSFATLAKQIQLRDAAVLHPNASQDELNKQYPGAYTPSREDVQKLAKELGTDKAPEKNAGSALPTLNGASGNKATADTKDAKAKEEGTKPADAKKDAATNNTKPADGAKPAEAATPADTAALAGDQSLATAPDDAQAANTKLASTGDMPLAAIPVVGAVLAGAVLFMRSRFVR